MTSAAAQPRLIREAFRTSRLAEFCSEKELVAQTGHPVAQWPLVIIKELVDNAIDIAEETEIAPVVGIEVSTERGEIVVTDNGPGIAPEVVDSVLDFSARTSSRAGYVAPTRGQQGNALQTILAMPCALSGGGRGETIIESRGVAQQIVFTVDPIRQEPRISCERSASSVKTGTRIATRWPANACHVLERADDRFLPLAWDFIGLNPHLGLMLDVDGEREINAGDALDPGWRKWSPSDPPPAHWYTPASLERLIAASVNRDRERGERGRSVRDFLAGFRGLSSTAKRSIVLDETGLARAPLEIFFIGDQVDRAGIARLLAAMQEHTRPVKPEQLGIIGKNNFRGCFAVDEADQVRFKYAHVLGDDGGLPFIVEAAFATLAEPSSTPIVSGINWSPSISGAFRAAGLDYILAQQHVDLDLDDVVVAIHLATPVVQFVDRGKSTAALGPEVRQAVLDAVRRVTKDHAAAEEARRRDLYKRSRSQEREAKAEEREERRRQRAARAEVVGSGVLYQEIAEAAETAGIAISSLTVLSSDKDPYRFDTDVGHRDGVWFAGQVERFVAADKQIHLRGLFYAVVASADVKRPDGTPLVNDFACWKWLQDKAAKAGRWLGYVPHERICDQRNDPPLVISYALNTVPGLGQLHAYHKVEVPRVDDVLPYLGGGAPVVQQPYRIILVGEKSSLAEVLEPIAEMVGGELLLPTGEMSDTMIAEMAARAAADPRPAVVLYVSDFDPAGHQMPISVARKLQALRRQRYPGLRIEVHRVALTLDQVCDLGLPSTPLKKTEKRARKWRERMGHEQTEVDALAALRPTELRRFMLEAVAPFWDPTLEGRCNAAFREWLSAALPKLHAHPAWPGIKAALEQARADLEAAVAALDDAQAEALKQLTDKDGITEVEIPAPEVRIEAVAPPPLFTTADDFVKAAKRLIASKALDDDDETDA